MAKVIQCRHETNNALCVNEGGGEEIKTNDLLDVILTMRRTYSKFVQYFKCKESKLGYSKLLNYKKIIIITIEN